MNEWLANLSNLVGVLSAAGLLGGGVWLYRRENKRIKRAEASKAEADLHSMAAHEWKDLAEAREVKLQKKEEQITGLFDQIGKWRDKCDEKDTRIHELELKLMSYEMRLCNRRGCADREPQTGF